MAKKVVLIIVTNYPQLSQTYKENEFKYLVGDYEVFVAATSKPDKPTKMHFPYFFTPNAETLAKLIKQIRPDVIHGHYLFTLPTVASAAKAAGNIPYTLRGHSFDMINKPREYLQQYNRFVEQDNFAGLLVFPFMIPTLIEAGYSEEKLIPSYPVVDYQRFFDRSPNGDGVINTGACIPKKAMHEYVDLAKLVPEKSFELIPIGYKEEKLTEYNRAAGSPLTIGNTVEPWRMPKLYKRARWLVYTADRTLADVGWPMAIAEAQASGCGVLIQNIRPDMADYIDGAGYTFENLDEAAERLRTPYPTEMRERGFEVAKRSDIAVNIAQLIALWEL